MGNEIEIDLNKYNCSCFQKEDGCFINFINDIKTTDPFNFVTTTQKMSQSELMENTPGGIKYPNDNMVKSALKKKGIYKKPKISTFKYESSDNEKSESSETKNKNKIINSIHTINDDSEKEKDIKDFDNKTDYFLLANQINNAINELKMNLYINDDNKLMSLKTSTPEMDDKRREENLSFEKAIKKVGKSANKTIFYDIINCLKRICEIHSEVILIKEKIYLGIVKKFRKEKKDKNLINYEDKEKIVELPNFWDIKEKNREKLGDKYNNSKFKFNKFTLKGSFPNEILIWNLISQNTQEIAKVLTENYYCCIVLLYYSKVEEENETIMYLINKPT